MYEDIFYYKQPFQLESGEVLPEFQLAYSISGELLPEAKNIIWVCHALTGNHKPQEWWGIVGENAIYSPERYCIICANMLGSCYGSTGALSENPNTKQPYFHDFPFLTNRDAAAAFDLLRQHLGIQQIHTLIGGSLGGQQAMEWAILRPHLFQHLILVATNAKHSAWGIAFNESQRMAIAADSSWKNNSPEAGLNGMKAARAIALLSYRTYQIYEENQTDDHLEIARLLKASSYQQYQGEKLAKRFNAFSYYTLSHMMDTHDVGRNRKNIIAALSQIEAKTLVVSIETDLLFPPCEQEFLAQHIKNATFHSIASVYGHDGFLVEIEALTQAIQDFYKN
jgi:homoserine O-acetyltransferase